MLDDRCFACPPPGVLHEGECCRPPPRRGVLPALSHPSVRPERRPAVWTGGTFFPQRWNALPLNTVGADTSVDSYAIAPIAKPRRRLRGSGAPMPSMPESQADLESIYDVDVPPSVVCASCGSVVCLGCRMHQPPAPCCDTVPWESSEGIGHRLWQTAELCSTNAAAVFGAMPRGKVIPALRFALVAETLAVGSFAAVAAMLLWMLRPPWLSQWLVSSEGLIVGGVCLGASTMGMIWLHVAWGMCIELGAASAGLQPDWSQGLRFGLYACAWDLFTSPIGIVRSLANFETEQRFDEIGAALRAPQAAMRAYASEHRRFDRRAQRRGSRLSFVVLGGMVLFAASAVLLALLSALWQHRWL